MAGSTATAPHPYSYSCDQTATCHLAEVAKIQDGTEFKNTLVLYRKIQVRVLDCRSGEPLTGAPVEEVRINGKTIVRYTAANKDWDISKNFPIYEKDGKWLFGQTEVSLLKASQIALNALGFDCGAPGNAYGGQGKTAFLQYLVRTGEVALKDGDLKKIKLFEVKKLADKHLKPPKKDRLKGIVDEAGAEVPFKEPSPEQCKKIIAIYNTRSYRAAQFHLATLGYYANPDDPLADGAMDDKDSGQWTESWIRAFHDWQKVEFGYKEEQCWDWIKRDKEGKRLMEQARNFVSNDQGDVHIPVPVSLLTTDWTLELSFKHFAVVAEATEKEHQQKKAKICRAFYNAPNPAGKKTDPNPKKIPLAGATHFSVEWADTEQKTGWDQPWGWRLGKNRSQSPAERQAFAEFRTSWKFEVPKFDPQEASKPDAKLDWMALHKKTQAFSMFYHEGEDQPEFVLFALVWCQPVWDDFEDPPAGPQAAANQNCYLWPGSRPEDIGRHMHIVTQYYDMGGWDVYGGKGYGLYEHDDHPTRWRGGDGHHGIDLHAPVGMKLFAVHGGKLSYNPNAGGLGKNITVSWSGNPGKYNGTGYGHCSELVGADGREVRAGEIVAKAGRTGILFPNSDQAGHVHLTVTPYSGGNRDKVRLRETPDEANQVCIPFNQFDGNYYVTRGTPLLFPCRCEVKKGASELAGCQFENVKIPGKETMSSASVCWAVNDLICPHMPRAVTLAQLKGPGASKEKRRVQAQLRKLGYYMPDPVSGPGNTQWKDAAQSKALDGDFGTYIEEVTVTAEKAKVRPAPSTDNKEFGIVSKGTKLAYLGEQGEWYNVELPQALRTATSGDAGWIHGSLAQKSGISQTCLAILAFKTDKGLLPKDPTPEQKYEIDQPTLDKINELAPIAPLT